MLSGLILKINKNLWVIGGAILTVLAFFARLQYLKGARDRALVKADTMKATVHAERVKREAIKQQELLNSRRRVKLIKDIKKEGEDFEGVDNLTDSNDF